MTRIATRARLWLALMLAVLAAQAQQAAPPPSVPMDRAQLERRLTSVEALLHSSTASRQVEASGDPQALERRRQARALYQRATQAFEAGDAAKTAALIAEASARMFEAVRLAAPEALTAAKQRTDFDARLESVKALHAAHQRILAEKPGVPGSVEAGETVARFVQEAEGQAQAGDLATARATLDRAYLVAKAAVSSMRAGDTLVRSLEFANKREEYDYEIDRNDTHRMLIRMLVEDKRRTAGAERTLQEHLERAAQLRGRGEIAAAAGDHVGAVSLLEESTRWLIKAIRGAGIYIPG